LPLHHILEVELFLCMLRGHKWSSVVVLLILNLNTRWKWVVSIPIWLLHPWAKSYHYPWIWAWVGRWTGMVALEKRPISYFWESNHVSLVVQPIA